MDLGIPPLKIKDRLESKLLKSRFLARELLEFRPDLSQLHPEFSVLLRNAARRLFASPHEPDRCGSPMRKATRQGLGRARGRFTNRRRRRARSVRELRIWNFLGFDPGRFLPLGVGFPGPQGIPHMAIDSEVLGLRLLSLQIDHAGSTKPASASAGLVRRSSREACMYVYIICVYIYIYIYIHRERYALMCIYIYI